MPESRAAAFLQMIRRSQRGRLKVYLGYGAGVGKTYGMLLEAHRLKREGIDVVIGFVETHGREETARLIEGLEVVPRKRVEYHGIAVEEMDLDAVLARHPQVALVDELAHTNLPGSKNEKRYQDVEALLASGIHIITTVNLQHVESLYNTVEDLIGVKVRERLPDSVLAEADQVVNVDLSPEDLEKRLREGKIYPPERIATALENFFRPTNLEQLRELTLRELASQIDAKRREVQKARDGTAPDQVMVCLSSRGPNSARLLRFASRVAGRLNRNWYAVYVQTPSEAPTAIDATTQRLLSDTLTLANQLGATVFTYKGSDVVDTIIRFAREYRVGHIVIGRSKPLPSWKRFLGRRTIGEELVSRAKGFTIVVVDAQAAEEGTNRPAQQATAAEGQKETLARLLKPGQVSMWMQPVTKDQVLRELVSKLADDHPAIETEEAIRRIEDRERQGSTFLNEGVAIPHARVPGIDEPLVALGLPRAGVVDAPTESPLDAVFLFLFPAEGDAPSVHLLAAAGRIIRSPDLRQRLREARTEEEAVEAIASASSNAVPRD